MLMGCKKQRCEPLAAWDVCVDGLKASTGALNTLFVQPIIPIQGLTPGARACRSFLRFGWARDHEFLKIKGSFLL